MVTSQILPCGLHVVKDLLFLGKLFKMLLLAAKSRSGSCQDAAGASTAISFLDRMQQKNQVKANAAGKTLYRAQLPSSHLEQQDQLTCCHLPLTASTLHHPPHSLSPGAHREVAVPFGQGSCERLQEIILFLLVSHHVMIQITVCLTTHWSHSAPTADFDKELSPLPLGNKYWALHGSKCRSL